MLLNEQQKQAIGNLGNTCIQACPGSGKTRTILSKLLLTLDEVRGTARKVACITYTNATVDEIELRLREYGIGQDEDLYEINTVHAFCLGNILQPFYYLLPNLSNGFRIISPESEEWREIITGIAEIFSVSRNQSDSFALIHRKPDGSIFVPGEIPDEAAEMLINQLDSKSLVAFSDIIFLSYRLIEKNSFIARGLSSKFCWIIVDEFQDTSEGQVLILEKIASYKKTHFFVVGDINQSIMGFADAHPELMNEFTRIIGIKRNHKLFGNYRCSSKIVEQAESLVPTKPAMESVGLCKDIDIIPQLFLVETPVRGIIDYYIPAIANAGIKLGDAAILAPWWLPLFHLARELRALRIPIIGPGSRPYRRTHLFANIAEILCAYTIDPSPDLFRRIQRALFYLISSITGTANWDVFSYDGRVCAATLIKIAETSFIDQTTCAANWLKSVSAKVAAKLQETEFLPSHSVNLIITSAEDMISDMERNTNDVSEITVADLGLYAKPKDCLQLITMHSSKGREFDAVAIIDLHEGRVPHFRATTKEEIEECRRLLYVSITRAKKLLMYFIDSSNQRNRPSRFLSELGLI